MTTTTSAATHAVAAADTAATAATTTATTTITATATSLCCDFRADQCCTKLDQLSNLVDFAHLARLAHLGGGQDSSLEILVVQGVCKIAGQGCQT